MTIRCKNLDMKIIFLLTIMLPMIACLARDSNKLPNGLPKVRLIFFDSMISYRFHVLPVHSAILARTMVKWQK